MIRPTLETSDTSIENNVTPDSSPLSELYDPLTRVTTERDDTQEGNEDDTQDGNEDDTQDDTQDPNQTGLAEPGWVLALAALYETRPGATVTLVQRLRHQDATETRQADVPVLPPETPIARSQAGVTSHETPIETPQADNSPEDTDSRNESEAGELDELDEQYLNQLGADDQGSGVKSLFDELSHAEPEASTSTERTEDRPSGVLVTPHETPIETPQGEVLVTSHETPIETPQADVSVTQREYDESSSDAEDSHVASDDQDSTSARVESPLAELSHAEPEASTSTERTEDRPSGVLVTPHETPIETPQGEVPVTPRATAIARSQTEILVTPREYDDEQRSDAEDSYVASDGQGSILARVESPLAELSHAEPEASTSTERTEDRPSGVLVTPHETPIETPQGEVLVTSHETPIETPQADVSVTQREYDESSSDAEDSHVASDDQDSTSARVEPEASTSKPIYEDTIEEIPANIHTVIEMGMLESSGDGRRDFSEIAEQAKKQIEDMKEIDEVERQALLRFYEDTMELYNKFKELVNSKEIAALEQLAGSIQRVREILLPSPSVKRKRLEQAYDMVTGLFKTETWTDIWYGNQKILSAEDVDKAKKGFEEIDAICNKLEESEDYSSSLRGLRKPVAEALKLFGESNKEVQGRDAAKVRAEFEKMEDAFQTRFLAEWEQLLRRKLRLPGPIRRLLQTPGGKVTIALWTAFVDQIVTWFSTGKFPVGGYFGTVGGAWVSVIFQTIFAAPEVLLYTNSLAQTLASACQVAYLKITGQGLFESHNTTNSTTTSSEMSSVTTVPLTTLVERSPFDDSSLLGNISPMDDIDEGGIDSSAGQFPPPEEKILTALYNLFKEHGIDPRQYGINIQRRNNPNNDPNAEWLAKLASHFYEPTPTNSTIPAWHTLGVPTATSFSPPAVPTLPQ